VSLGAPDRLEILELVARAEIAATARDAGAYVGLFTEDAVLDGAMGEHPGREALAAGVGPIWAAEGERSEHLAMNTVIDAIDTDPSSAIVHSTLMIVVHDPDARIGTVVPITQRVAKVDGRWLIRRRTVGS
jgi:uncharacterized protein (TIGR02246 family)